MKKLIVPFLLIFLIHGNANTQSCLPEGIYFHNQTEVDTFRVNYQDCKIIEGNVTINGQDINNLDSLIGLTSIEGDLQILNNTSLTSFTGLDMLTAIGGDFYIEDNPSLINFAGLSNLTNLGGYMFISDNGELTNFTGLESLENTYGLFIYDNDNLLNLNGLSGLTAIPSDFFLQYNDNLTSLTGIGNLSSIGRALRISHNPELESLSGLEALTHIDSSLRIYQNNKLTSIAGIANLNAWSLDDLGIYSNDSLSVCHIESLCNYLANPTGIVTIYNNKSGCNNPSEVATQCGFTLPCLPLGDYYLYTQDEVDNFQTLYPGCTFLGGKTEISGPDITNLLGLSGVEGFERQLKLYNIPSLASLSGLEGVTYIGKSLHITDNNILTSLTGLGNFNTSNLIVMTIAFNDSLSFCAIQSVCDFIENHGPGTDISISSNNQGCNNEMEVEEVCNVGIDNYTNNDLTIIYPNPARNMVNFKWRNPKPGKVTLKIYNSQCQEITTLLNDEMFPGDCFVTWSTEAQSPGLYFYVITRENDLPSMQGRFIVMR